MARYATTDTAARYFHVHPRTARSWLTQGFIRGYDDGRGTIHVDIDEIEEAFKTNHRMRDGRKRYGKAIIVPMPVPTRPEEGEQ